MRINKYIASATGLSRRAADAAIAERRVLINGSSASLGDTVGAQDSVTFDGQPIKTALKATTLLINKPVGYVVSRAGQGSKTVYDLLPTQYKALKPVGRLDKDSSGLLLMTDDGELANQLTHPRYSKSKVYHISLNTPLQPLHQQMVSDHGIHLKDGVSQLSLMKLDDKGLEWQVTMSEGRNRQIRRTFQSLGYIVTKLHRLQFGPYSLDQMSPTQRFKVLD